MSKKTILITLGFGLLSFIGAFAFAWITKPSPASSPNEIQQPTKSISESGFKSQQPKTDKTVAIDIDSVTTTKAMTEQQLKNLIHDLRKKMQEYDIKLQDLKVQEHRLQVARDVLKDDFDKLHSLQIQLASITADLKNERDRLYNSRIEIDKNEQMNIVSIAATYDKMDASSASKILTNLCSSSETKTGQNEQVDNLDGSFHDAVKILYYMSERTKAKLLAELATSEPQLAAVLSQRLKQIVEVN